MTQVLDTIQNTLGLADWTAYQFITVGWILFCIISGWVRGFARSVYALISVIIAIVLAVKVMHFLGETYPALHGAASYFATAIIVCFILHWIGIATKLVNKVPLIGPINRLLGAISGGIVGLITYRFVVSVLLYFGKIGAQ